MNRLDLDGAEERREEMREKPQRFLTPFAPHSTLENWSAVSWSPLQAELQLLLLLIRKNICCAPKKAKKKNNIVENWREFQEATSPDFSIACSASMDVDVDANEPRPAAARTSLLFD